MQRFLFIIREDLSKLGKMTNQERYSRCVEEQRLVRKDQIIADGPFIDANTSR